MTFNAQSRFCWLQRKGVRTIRGAEIFLGALQKSGVRYLFGLPGSTEAAILDALAGNSELEYILGLHENVVVGMADGYARASGQVGVANLHTSVGTFNGLANLYNAWRDSSPVMMTVGHKDSRLFTRDGFCVVPSLPEFARQITKWSWQTVHPEEIAGDVYRGVKMATASPSGPVYLAIPEDLLAAEVDKGVPSAEGLSRVHSAVRPGRSALAQAVELLQEARRVVLVAGSEVATSSSTELVAKLAERLAAPVMLEQRKSNTALTFLSDHPNVIGRYAVNSPAIQEADVVFFVGGQVFLDFSYPAQPQVPAGAKLIHLHPSTWQLAKQYPTEVPLVGDVREGLTHLLEAFEGQKIPGETERKRFLVRGQQQPNAPKTKATPSAADPITGEWLAREMQRIFPPETIIVDEAIRTSRPLQAHYGFTVPNTYYKTSGGALGWGMPAALGVALARPKGKVVAVIGDGASLFTIQSLWTAAHHCIPVLTIICNNRKYMAVHSAIETYDGLAVQNEDFIGCTLDSPNIDYVGIAAGFGVPGRRVEQAGNMSTALQMGLKHPGPYVLEVVLEH